MRAQKDPAQSFGPDEIRTQHLSHAKQAPYHGSLKNVSCVGGVDLDRFI